MAIKPIVKEAVFALVLLGMTISVATNSLATEPFPPTRIYQKDGAWRVDYLGGSPLEVYGDGDRLPRFQLWIENALPTEEFERFVSKTTAGPEWASFAFHYFITMGEKPHFCARTWWKDDWTLATIETVRPALWMQTDRMEEHARPVGSGKSSDQRVSP